LRAVEAIVAKHPELSVQMFKKLSKEYVEPGGARVSEAIWRSECTFNISSYNIIISRYKCTFGYETECPHNPEGIPLDSKKKMLRHIYGRVPIAFGVDVWRISGQTPEAGGFPKPLARRSVRPRYDIGFDEAGTECFDGLRHHLPRAAGCEHGSALHHWERRHSLHPGRPQQPEYPEHLLQVAR
jgi:hypothetical protein